VLETFEQAMICGCQVVRRPNRISGRVQHRTSLTQHAIGLYRRSRGIHWIPAAAAQEDHVLECETAKSMLDSKTCMFVDMRSEKEYDYEHITKPPRMTVNIPYQGEVEEFVSRVEGRFGNAAGAGLLLVCTNGEIGISCAKMLRDRGYTKVFGVDGGYQGWMQQFTTSGRRRIMGKFVSSGKEALKSGLNLDSEVASTYEENWGNPELSLPSNRSNQIDP
jgi:rhodanese-related sulfurtransferase